VLRERTVSSLHARIRYQNGSFLIEDQSQNGVFINSKQLAKGQPYELKDGDLILIDPYEIRASIDADQNVPSLEPDPFAQSGVLDLDKLLPVGPGPRPRPGPRQAGPLGGSPHEDPYIPPNVIPPAPRPAEPAGRVLIPDEPWEPGSPLEPPPVPRPVPPRPPAPPQAPPVDRPSPAPAPYPSSELAEFLAGAGLPPHLATPELARDLGRILRIVVKGVIEVLRSRQEIKNEFRMEMTHFRSQRNNPLKFSANEEDALQNLLLKKNAAYLGPVESFEDAFDDVVFHQMSMLAGMRAALDAVVMSLGPDVLQEEFDRQAKGVISVPGKLRYWDQYRAKFGDMVAGTKAWDLFSEEFAKAYDDQLQQLKAERRSRKPQP
jgi:type VI secretion system FHA domain protein